MVKFGIVVNPRSRRMRKPGAIDRLYSLTKGYDVAIEIPEVSDVPSPETYKKPLEKLLDQDIDALLVCSGDGGHHLVDTALLDVAGYGHFPPQANLRGGTINVRADSANLPRRGPLDVLRYSTVEHVLKNILHQYAQADKVKTVSRKLLSVSTIPNGHLFSDGTTKRYLGFSYSDGLLPKMFEEFYGLGGHHISALGVLWRFLSSFPFDTGLTGRLFEPVEARVSINNTFRGDRYLGFLVLAQDIRMDFGPIELGSKQVQDVSEGKDLRTLLIQKGTKWDLLCQIPHTMTLRGRPAPALTSEHVEQRDADQILIQAPKGHQFFVDGDIYTTEYDGYIAIRPFSDVPYLTL